MFRNLFGGSRKNETCMLLKVTVIVEPDGEGFHAYCPALPGLHVGGDTEEEGLENAREAIVAYIASLLKHNEPVPIGPDLTLFSAGMGEVPQVPAWMVHEIQLPWPSQSTLATS
jgi:predicted RNase H-like HicB family nuclease